jgi:hypothetical protein
MKKASRVITKSKSKRRRNKLRTKRQRGSGGCWGGLCSGNNTGVNLTAHLPPPPPPPPPTEKVTLTENPLRVRAARQLLTPDQMRTQLEKTSCETTLRLMDDSYSAAINNYEKVLQYYYKQKLRNDIVIDVRSLDRRLFNYKNIVLQGAKDNIMRLGKKYLQCKRILGRGSTLEQLAITATGPALLEQIERSVSARVQAEKVAWDSQQISQPGSVSQGQTILGTSMGIQARPWSPTFNEDDEEVKDLYFNF